MNRPTSRKRKADLLRQLERDVAKQHERALRDALAYGTGFLKDGAHVPLKDALLPLKDALRNVSRTATRRLDEAGVPDHLQGASEDDWDMDENERNWHK